MGKSMARENIEHQILNTMEILITTNFTLMALFSTKKEENIRVISKMEKNMEKEYILGLIILITRVITGMIKSMAKEDTNLLIQFIGRGNGLMEGVKESEH